MVRHSSQVCVKGHWLHEGCYHSVGTLFFWTLAFYSILSILPQLSMPPYRAGKASAIEKKIQPWPQWPRIKFPCFYFCNRRNAKRYEKKDNKAEESGKPGKNVNTGTEKKRAQEPDTTESAPPPRKSRKQKNWSKGSHVDVYFGAAVGNLCKKITGYTTCSLIWKWFLLANQFAMWPVLLWQNIYRCLDTFRAFIFTNPRYFRVIQLSWTIWAGSTCLENIWYKPEISSRSGSTRGCNFWSVSAIRRSKGWRYPWIQGEQAFLTFSDLSFSKITAPSPRRWARRASHRSHSDPIPMIWSPLDWPWSSKESPLMAVYQNLYNYIGPPALSKDGPNALGMRDTYRIVFAKMIGWISCFDRQNHIANRFMYIRALGPWLLPCRNLYPQKNPLVLKFLTWPQQHWQDQPMNRASNSERAFGKLAITAQKNWTAHALL